MNLYILVFNENTRTKNQYELPNQTIWLEIANADVALFRSANFTTREGWSDAETVLVIHRDINFLPTIVCRHSNSGFGRLKPNTEVAGSYANKNQHQD